MIENPILMEDYFTPGFKVHPLVHAGSQTLRVWKDKPEEQAFESFFMVGAHGKDAAVVRDIDPEYLKYWTALIGEVHVVNLIGLPKGDYLSDAILNNKEALKKIKKEISPGSQLLPFQITQLEQDLAQALEIPLHGSLEISNNFGTKSGIRKLALEENIPMAPGFVANDFIQVEEAIDYLEEKFEELVVKHSLSAAGYMSARMKIKEFGNVREKLNELAGGIYKEREDVFVVEGWIKNKASLCAQIEIPAQGDPVVCAGWQQILEADGISYMGAGPLRLSKKALKSFIRESNKLAWALKKRGAVGCFGPDFLIVSEEEKNMEADTCVLIELNARAPVTSLPLEAVLHIRGYIGEGFCSTHIKLSKVATFKEIAQVLDDNSLLIKSSGKDAKGVVVFNPGMIPYKMFDIIAMAPTWEETEKIVKKTKNLFEMA